MTDLCKLFIQTVRDTEGLDASNYSPFHLKKRPQKSFPQLTFPMTFAGSQGEIVFSEDLTSGELAERHDTVRKCNYDTGEGSDEEIAEEVCVEPLVRVMIFCI